MIGYQAITVFHAVRHLLLSWLTKEASKLRMYYLSPKNNISNIITSVFIKHVFQDP